MYLYLENLDMIVIGAGTCGTLTGVARKIKERQPKCKVSRLYIKHNREVVHLLAASTLIISIPLPPEHFVLLIQYMYRISTMNCIIM